MRFFFKPPCLTKVAMVFLVKTKDSDGFKCCRKMVWTVNPDCFTLTAAKNCVEKSVENLEE